MSPLIGSAAATRADDAPAPPLAAALAAWSAALGAEHVRVDAATLRAVERTTFALERSVPAVLRPADRAQVQQCLRIAQRYGVPVYPVSGGKNWGYGSRVPAADRCALLDLARLDRIVAYDERLAYVTVEPGVTQRQLHAFLQERGGRLWMDPTGASPDASVLANTLERGFGHTPYGDHFAHACGLEVVLPSGELIETGLARFANSAAAPVYRWGVGPSLDGLFSQSNLGVVTRASIGLMPAPAVTQAFFFRCDDDAQLAAALDRLRPLRLDGTIRSAVHIGNDYKVLSALRQYPWEELGGATPLPPARMAAFRARHGFGAWSGSGALYGTRAQVAASRALVRAALRGCASKVQFVDERTLRLAGRWAGPLRRLTSWDLTPILDAVRPVVGLLRGTPTTAPLASVYWRKRAPPPARPDPDADRCGLLWCAPIAPLDGAHALALWEVLRTTLLGHGFEPIVSLTLVTERALAAVVSIVYDRDAPGEDDRARACYDALLRGLNARGYYSYRLGIQSMGEMDGPPAYATLLRSLKGAVDPGSVLAPGRYEPSARARG